MIAEIAAESSAIAMTENILLSEACVTSVHKPFFLRMFSPTSVHIYPTLP
jgi:hypothetical protein